MGQVPTHKPEHSVLPSPAAGQRKAQPTLKAAWLPFSEVPWRLSAVKCINPSTSATSRLSDCSSLRRLQITQTAIINTLRASLLLTNASTSESQLSRSSQSVTLAQTQVHSWTLMKAKIQITWAWAPSGQSKGQQAGEKQQENFLCNELNFRRKNRKKEHNFIKAYHNLRKQARLSNDVDWKLRFNHRRPVTQQRAQELRSIKMKSEVFCRDLGIECPDKWGQTMISNIEITRIIEAKMSGSIQAVAHHFVLKRRQVTSMRWTSWTNCSQ